MNQTQTDMKPALGWRALAAGAAAVLFLVADQLTKLAVRAQVGPQGWSVPAWRGVFHLEFVRNVGAAFSLGEGMGLAFVVLALAITAFAVYYLLRAPLVSRVEVVGIGMVVGGALGNAIDRLALGYVTDFIACDFINFPVFNVADIGITVGIAVAFIGYLFLSPANREVDATAELNRRDAEDAARRAERRAKRSRKKGR